jgi:hypothetical protein
MWRADPLKLGGCIEKYPVAELLSMFMTGSECKLNISLPITILEDMYQS